ncbi:hypothetical protein LCGC14_1588910 [marine sediment metagenome]|uniref:Uncharacterized protein n=1 Tax=marine sediment metagenome TaxID=412755 RepID=A0A0F9IEM4_9ZZZZ
MNTYTVILVKINNTHEYDCQLTTTPTIQAHDATEVIRNGRVVGWLVLGSIAGSHTLES